MNVDYVKELERIVSSGKAKDAPEKFDALFEKVKKNDAIAALPVLFARAVVADRSVAFALRLYSWLLQTPDAQATAVSACLDLLEKHERFSELALALEELLAREPPILDSASVAERLGTVLWKRLGAPDRAEVYWRRVRKLHPDAADMLTFYREFLAPDPAGLLAVFAQAIRHSTDARFKQNLTVESAILCEKAALGVEKAIDLWQRVLESDTAHQAAREALRRLYQQGEQWNALIELLEQDIDKAEAHVRRSTLFEIVDIYENRLRSPVMVISGLRRILRLDANDQQAEKRLIELLEKLGRWGELRDIISEQLAHGGESADQLPLLRKQAFLLADRLGDRDRALQLFEKVNAIRPDDEEVVDRLRGYYHQRRLWKALFALEEQVFARLQPSLSEEAKRQSLRNLIELAQDRLDDKDRATALLERYCHLVPDDTASWLALSKLYERQNRLPESLDSLLQAADLTSEPARALGHYRKALAQAVQLKDAKREVMVLQRALGRFPGEAKFHHALAEAYINANDRAGLVGLYTDRKDATALFESLLRGAEYWLVEARAQAAGWYEQAAQVAENELSSPDRAISILEKIITLRPVTLVDHANLCRLYEKTKNWPQLLAAYERFIADLNHKPADEGYSRERVELMHSAAALCEEKLGAPLLALDWWWRILEICPDDAGVLDQCLRLAGINRLWTSAIAHVESHFKWSLVSLHEQARIHRWLALHALQDVKDAALARPHWEWLYRELPYDDETGAILAEIYYQQKEFDLCADVLLDRAKRSLESHLWVELAILHEKQRNDPSAAVEAYRHALAFNANREEEVNLLLQLERLLRAASNHSDVAIVIRQRMLRDTGLLAQARNKLAWELVTHATEFHITLDAQRSIIAETLEDTADATMVPLLKSLFQIAATATPAASWLPLVKKGVAVAEQLNDSETLALALDTTLTLGSGTDPDRDSIIESRLKLGHLTRERQFALHRELFQNRPDSSARLVATLQSAKACDRITEAIDVVGAEKSRQPSLAANLTRWLAEWLSGHEPTHPKLETIWSDVLVDDPADGRAYAELARLYQSTRSWPNYVRLLDQQLDKTADVVEISRLLRTKINIEQNELQDPSAACRSAERLALFEPTLENKQLLDEFLVATQAWQKRDHLLQEIISEADAEEQTAARIERLENASQHLRNADLVLDIAEEILAHDPYNAESIECVLPLLDVTEQRKRAADLLVGNFEIRRDWLRVAETLLRILPTQTIPAERCETLFRVANLFEYKLDQKDKALVHWCTLFAESQDIAHFFPIEKIAGALERWSDLLSGYRLSVTLTHEHTDEHSRRLAFLIEEQFPDFLNEAAGLWERLEIGLGSDEQIAEATSHLERILERQNNLDGLAGLYERQFSRLHGPRQIETARKLARLFEIDKKQPLEAIKWLERASAFHPEDQALIGDIDRLYLAQGDLSHRIELRQKQLATAYGESNRFAILNEILFLQEESGASTREQIDTLELVRHERPQHLPVFPKLAQLYRKLDLPADALAVMESELETRRALQLSDAYSQKLEFEIALAHEENGQVQDALAQYQTILADRSDDQVLLRCWALLDVPAFRDDATQTLRHYYQTRRLPREEIRLLEHLAATATDPGPRFVHLVEQSDLLESTGDLKSAFFALKQALSLQAADIVYEHLQRFERLGETTGNRLAIIQTYPAIVDSVDSPALGRHMIEWVAQEAARTANSTLAEEYFRRILDSDPDDQTTLEQLEKIYRSQRRYPELVEILEKYLSDAREPNHRVKLLEEIARLEENELQRPGEAIAYYRQLLEVESAAGRAETALQRLFLSSKQYWELADLLEGKLNKTPNPQQSAALHLELGRVYDELLQNRKVAAEHYARAIAGDVEDATVESKLREYLRFEETREEAAEALEYVYTTRQEWKGLGEVLRVKYECARDAGERLVVLRKIARLHDEQLEDYAGAFFWYCKLFVEEPNEPSIDEQLFRLVSFTRRWTDLIVFYRDWLRESVDDPIRRTQVMEIVGSLYETNLKDFTGAAEWYERVIEHDAERPHVWTSLETIYRSQKDWHKLAALLGRLSDQDLSDKVRLETLRNLAQVEDLRANSLAAIDAWERVFALDEQDAQAFERLSTLYREAGNGDSEIQLLERWLALPNPGRDDAKMRWADLLVEIRGDVAAAVEICGELLERSPTHEAAIKFLEKLYQSDRLPGDGLVLLGNYYRRKSMWKPLAQIISRRIENEGSSENQWQWLVELAGVEWDLLHDAAAAFRSFARLWKDFHTTTEYQAKLNDLRPTIETIARKAHELRGWSAALLEAGREGWPSDSKGELLRQSLRIAYELNDDALVLQVLATLDEDGLVTLDERRAWDELLERLRRAKDRPPVLRAILEETEPPTEKIAVAVRLAHVFENDLNEPERAIQMWRDLLDAGGELVSAQSSVVYRELERLFRKQNDISSLIEIVDRQRYETLDRIDWARISMRLALIHEQDRQDLESALDCYRAVATERGDFVDAHKGWVRLARSLERPGSVLEALDARAEHAEPGEAAVLQMAAGHLLWRELSDPEAALARFSLALRESSTREEAVTALWQLLRTEQLEAAATTLEEYFFLANDPASLLNVVDEHAACSVDVLVKTRILQFAAAWSEGVLSDPKAALFRWVAIALLDSENGWALAPIDRLAEKSQAFSELAQAYEKLLPIYQGTSHHLSMALKAAQVFDRQLGLPDRAIAILQECTPEAPGGSEEEVAQYAEALAELDRLLSRAGRFLELIPILERRADNAANDIDRAHFYYHTGAIYYEELHDLDSAAAALVQSLTIWPDHRAAEQKLQTLLLAADPKVHVPQSPADFMQAYEQLLAMHAAAARLTDWALLAERRLGWSQSPTELFERSVEFADQLHGQTEFSGAVFRVLIGILPGHFASDLIWEKLFAVAHSQTDKRQLNDWLKAHENDERVRDANDALALSERMATLWKTSDIEQTIFWLKHACRSRTATPEVQSELIATLRAVGRYDELVKWYLAEADRAAESAQKLEWYGRAAEELRTHVAHDIATRRRSCQAIYDLDPEADTNADELSTLIAQERDWSALEKIIRARAERTLDIAQQTRHLKSLLTLYFDEKVDLEKVWPVAQRLIENDPAAAEANVWTARLEDLAAESNAIASLWAHYVARWQAPRDAQTSIWLADRMVKFLASHPDWADGVESNQNVIDRLTEITFDVPELALAFDLLEKQLTRHKNWSGLVDLLQRRLESATSSALQQQFRLKIGAVFAEHLGDLSRARDIWSDLLAPSQCSVDTVRAIGGAVMADGDARSWFGREIDTLLEVHPSQTVAAELEYWRALIAEQSSDMEKMDRAVTALRQMDPHHPGLVQLERRWLSVQERWPELAAWLENQAQPSYADLTELLALYRDRIHDPTRSLRTLERLVALPEAGDVLRFALVEAYAEQGQTAQAGSLLETIRNQTANNTKEQVAWHRQVGRLWRKLGDAARARQEFERSQALAPQDMSVLEDLGVIYAHSGEWDLAQKTFRRVLVQPQDTKDGEEKSARGSAYYWLGYVYEQQSDFRRAKEMFLRGLDCAPLNEELKHALARMESKAS